MTSEAALRFTLKYWKEILMTVLVVLVIGKFRYDYGQLETAYETSQESLRAQIEGLRSIHQRELARREEALISYRDTLVELEAAYLESQLELERRKRETHRGHIEDFSGNKEKLIEDIESTYRFTYAP
tara:strand:+ start:3231 stop:3614 length:384 start_codon:yes stop_codon:yes gene_type:complete